MSFKVTYDPLGDKWSLYYFDGGTSAFTNPSASTWIQAGIETVNSTYTSSAMTTFGFALNYSSTAGRTGDFDNFSVGLGALAPVQMTSFTASATKTGATLSSKTATETNCFGYAVERRAVGSSATEKLGFVKGAGTSSIAHEYSYNDNSAAPGRYVYSIVQQDNDGTSKTYSAAEVAIGTAAKELSLGNYPNPFNPTTRIVFSVPKDGHAVVNVFNILGQLVYTAFDGQATAGQYTYAQFDGAKFASGIYYYSIESNGQRLVKRMLMLK